MNKKTRKYIGLLLWLLPVLSIVSTGLIWNWSRKMGNRDLAHRFELRTNYMLEGLDSGLQSADDMLHACNGLFNASEAVTRAEWSAFVGTLDPMEYNPGIQHIGYVARVPAGQAEAFVRGARAGGYPGYAITPAGARKEYFPILYQYPALPRGRRLVGYDMGSEPGLLAAMERAAETGDIYSSPVITLTPFEPGAQLKKGIILFRPLYNGGKKPAGPGSRRKELKGFASMAIFVGRMAALGNDNIETGVHMRLFDLSNGEAVIFESVSGGRGEAVSENYRPDFKRTLPIDKFGLRWRAEFISLPSFTERYRMGHLGVLLAGALLTLALAWLARTQDERVKALEQAEEAVEALRLTQYTLDNTGTPVFLTRPDSSIFYVNWASSALLGYSMKELLSMTALDLNPQYMTPEGWRANWEELKRKEKVVYETNLKHRDGSLVPVEITATYLRHGEKELKCVFVHDLRERRKAETELRKLAAAIESGPSVVVITDIKGNIEYVNPKFTETTGYTAAEARGQNPRLLKSGTQTQEYYKDLWVTILAGKVWTGEFCNKKKNGDLYWELAAIAPVRNADGKIAHFVAVKEEITDRKLMEAELKRAKEAAEAATRAKGVFLSSMSHEIRTPLNAILGFSQLMRRDPGLTPGLRQQVDTINRSGRHLLALINDILEISKIEAGRAVLAPAPFELPSMLADVENMFRQRAEEKGVELTVEKDGGLPRFVRGDEGKLRQILVNLLGNAFKFTAKGSVSVRTASSARSEKNLRFVAEVRDTGPGMTAEEAGVLFTPFEQGQAGKDAGGSGLGLTISREYARLMGGDITVSSKAGSGSVFRVEVDLEPATAAAMRESREGRRVKSLAPGQPKYRVLIADDKADNRDFLRGLLVCAGFEVMDAENGEAAVRVFGERRPHLVLMDIRMPVMNGYEAAMRIRAMTGGKDAKILVLSASSMGDVRKEALDNGADDYLPKPFREEDLFEMIRRLTGAEYSYEEAPPVPACAPESGKIEPGVFDRLPADLARRVREAAVSGDFDLLGELAGEAAGADAAAGEALKCLAGRFDAKTILELLPGGKP